MYFKHLRRLFTFALALVLVLGLAPAFALAEGEPAPVSDYGTVIFNANGGSGSMANMTVAAGTHSSLSPNAFAREGYDFVGWATSAGGSAVYGNMDNCSLQAGETLSLYAVWQPVTVSVSFYHGTGQIIAGSTTFTYGVDNKFPAPKVSYIQQMQNQNRYFKGWSENIDGSGARYYGGSTISTFSYDSSRTKTYYAQFEERTYTIVYHHNDGSDAAATKTFTLSSANAAPTISSVSRPGYTLTGYSTSEGSSYVSYEAGRSGPPRSYFDTLPDYTLHLYAQWTPWKTSLDFYWGQQNRHAAQSMTLTYGQDNILPQPFDTCIEEWTESGLVFCGWSTYANGGGGLYMPGHNMSTFSSTAPKSLYALLKPAPTTYTVIYHSNVPNEKTVTKTYGLSNDTDYIPLDVSFVRSGFSTKAFCTAADGSGTTYYFGDKRPSKADLDAIGVTTLHLYSVWTPYVLNLSYRYIDWTDEAAPDSVMTYGEKNSVNSPSNRKMIDNWAANNMLFSHWSSNMDGTGAKYYTDKTYTGFSYTGSVTNQTVYAQLTPGCRIDFFINGPKGNDMPDMLIYPNKAAKLNPCTFVNEGHKFMGWSTTPTGQVEYEDEAYITLTKNDTYVRLYAVWEATAPAPTPTPTPTPSPEATATPAPTASPTPAPAVTPGGNSNYVETGDESNVFLWVALSMACVGAFCVAAQYFKKRREE